MKILPIRITEPVKWLLATLWFIVVLALLLLSGCSTKPMCNVGMYDDNTHEWARYWLDDGECSQLFKECYKTGRLHLYENHFVCDYSVHDGTKETCGEHRFEDCYCPAEDRLIISTKKCFYYGNHSICRSEGGRRISLIESGADNLNLTYDGFRSWRDD